MSKGIVIIGNGIAGITVARHIRKRSEVPITVISSETDHFFSRTALMYVYMGQMKFEHTKPYDDQFWKRNRIDLLNRHISGIDVKNKKLRTGGGAEVAYDKLVIATGSKPNKYGWPGEDLPGVQGLYSYQDLELMERNSAGLRQAVIVGGGLIGVEMAEMLRSRGTEVTMLVREPHFWGNVLPEREGRFIGEHIQKHGVRLKYGTELVEILPGGDGRVKTVRDSGNEFLDCQFVGLTAGVSPNISFLEGSAIETERGVLVDRYFCTNIEDVFAVGDCVQHREPPAGRAPVEQVWYTGRKMGEIAAWNITGGEEAYDPGPWFNSAKFFDIEYQTYGNVPHEPDPGIHDLYWDPGDGKRLIHLVTEKETGTFKGINTFGIRMRHDIFDSWLRQGISTDSLVQQIGKADFNPEFSRHYVSFLQDAWLRAKSVTVV